MATVKEELKEKQLAVSGEQIEDIIKKSVEIDKNTAEIKDIKATLQEFDGSLDISELQAKVDKLEADYLKLNDFVVTNAADIASEKVRFNNFRETTKPIEEVTYTKEEADAITAEINEKSALLETNIGENAEAIKAIETDILKVEGEIKEINNTVNALDNLIIGKDTESVFAILYPRKNAYLQEYDLGDFINIIDSPTRAYTILDITGNDNIIVTPKTGFACSAIVKINGVYSQIHTWATESFVVTGAATECVLAFKHDDGSEFSATTTIDDVVVIEKQYVSIGIRYKLISTATLENVFSDVDRSVQGEAMQGMCSDGEYIYYYHDYPASIWKYKISTGEVTKKDTDCEHGNDMTYNNLTGRLYVCACESNLIYVVDRATLEVVETIDMTSKINGKVASISYVKNLNKYVIVGGEAYSEEKNTQSWTYKNMYVLNEYFNVEKTYLLENDTFANQGIETDDGYIYVLCTEVDGNLRHNYIKTYDLNGKLIGNYHIPTTEEAEALIKVSDTKFYISFNVNKGGTIKHLIISEYADISYFDVMTRYQMN